MSTSPACTSTQSLCRAREPLAEKLTSLTPAEPEPSAGCQAVGRMSSTTRSWPGNSTSPFTLAP